MRLRVKDVLILDTLVRAVSRLSRHQASAECRRCTRERVRYVGEPVAVVVATDRYLAEDALELIEIDYESLPVVMDPQAALDPIADHRSAQSLGNSEPDTRSCLVAFARQAKRREQRTGNASAVVIDSSEIGGPQNAGSPGKRLLATGAGFNGSSGQLFRR